MTKLIVLTFFLSGLIYIQTLEIKSSSFSAERRQRKQFIQTLIKRDPRCENDGIFAIPDDCTSYLVCKNGLGREKKCPNDFRFDSVNHCTDGDADCGITTLKQSDADSLCPAAYGLFSYPEDCHKYVICIQAKGMVTDCPEGQMFEEGVGCIEGNECPGVYESLVQRDDLALFECNETGVFANPRDCTTYIACYNHPMMREKLLIKCPPGQHYNIETKMCDFPCRAMCDQELACECGWPSCNSSLSSDEDSEAGSGSPLPYCYEDGIYPLLEDCSLFLHCIKGHAVFMSCPVGLHFNTETEKCDTPCRSQCNSDIPCFMEERLCDGEKCFQCPLEDGQFSDIYDCSIFHECVGGNSTIRACPPGRLFDHRSTRCLSKEKALCVYKCEELNSVHHHPQDANSYIHCYQGRPTVKKCPPSKVFHLEHGQCEDSDLDRNDIFDFLGVDSDDWTE